MQPQSKIAARLLALVDGRLVNPDAPSVIDKPTNLYQNEQQRYFTGRDFLLAVGNHWSQEDWRQFRAQLDGHVDFVDEWVRIFREDLDNPGRDSFRFGISWRVRKEDGQGSTHLTFYSNILTPLRGLPPTLILDAYAEQTVYDALFPEDSPQITVQGEARPLHIETAPMLRLDPLNLPRQPQKYLQIAEEVIKLHMEHPVTVLATKGMNEKGSVWHTHLQDAARRLHCPDLPLNMHHHAGRGKNQHAGRTIVALMPPHLPLVHECGTLAALFPYLPQARAEAHALLLEAEHLQMLHRGRQEAESGRIITGYKQVPKKGCVTRAYRPLLHFKSGSRHPRWRDALVAVAEEFVEHFGGVPRSLLGIPGIALIDVDYANNKTPALHADLLRGALRSLKLDDSSELGHWFHHGTLRRFHDVGTYRKKQGELLRTLLGKKLRLVSSKTCHVEVINAQTVKSTVWASKGESEKAIFNRIYS